MLWNNRTLTLIDVMLFLLVLSYSQGGGEEDGEEGQEKEDE